MQTPVTPKARHIELILRQIDSLPTLPSVATRMLFCTADDESRRQDVVALISADPALTAKVLSLCRSAERGVRAEVLTVDHAVLLLGFNAILNAALSVKVFDLFQEQSADDADGGTTAKPFDRIDFWRHCLAVAIASELIAGRGHGPEVTASEAFVCGLLHDVGKLALYHVLPKSYRRVVGLADLNQQNIANLERRVLGVDHHICG